MIISDRSSSICFDFSQKSVYAYCISCEAMEIRKLQRLTLQHCNLRSGVTTDFDRYKKFENSRAKPSRAQARHIGFVIYFKIAQTCILRYYSKYCKQIGRKSNCLLVKRLNVKTKMKIICSVTDRKLFVTCGFCGVMISSVIGYVTINIPDIFQVFTPL